MTPNSDKAFDEFILKASITGSSAREIWEAGATWQKSQCHEFHGKLKLIGTDGCCKCESGRVSMYAVNNGVCIECEHRDGK